MMIHRPLSFWSVARSEALKLGTTESVWFLAAVAVLTQSGLAVIPLIDVILAGMAGDTRGPAEPASTMANALLFGSILVPAIMLALGGTPATREFATGLAERTFTVVPKRRLLLAAKAAVVGTFAFLVGAVSGLAAATVAHAILQATGRADGIYLATIAWNVLALALWSMLIALIGFALGCLLRQAIWSLLVGLCAIYVVPATLIFLPADVLSVIGALVILPAVEPSVVGELAAVIRIAVAAMWASLALVLGVTAVSMRDVPSIRS